MAFFRNDAINRFYVHYGIQSLAAGAGGVFFLAFLVHAGLPLAAALATQAVLVAGRFVMRPLILPLGKRWGLKPLMIAGALVLAAGYPMLAEVHGLDIWLAALTVTFAVGDILYWPSFHAYFASVGDTEHRGHQIGAREAIAAVVNIVAPLIGGWALVTAGPRWAFAGVALIQALSVVPLIGAPNVPVMADAPGAARSAVISTSLFITEGWIAACFYFVWQLALFVSLGHSLAAYGGAMALAALVGAAIGLLLGRFIDLGHGRRAVLAAYGVTAVVVVLRAVSFGSPWLAVTANALGAIAGALMIPAMMAAVYNMAKASPCAFRFHIVSEGGWDIGCGAGCLVAAGLVVAGQSLAIAVLLALLGAAAATWVLWRYYGAHPEAAAAALELEPGAARMAETLPPV